MSGKESRRTSKPKLVVEQKWLITGIPDPEKDWYGPYDTRAEATDDKQGLDRFYKDNPEAVAAPQTDHLQELVLQTRQAISHLTPENVDWFRQRMEYVLHYLERRENLPEN